MTREADDQKHKTDAAIAELEMTRREVTEEKEQFYVTKWREGNQFRPVREPQGLAFVVGQGPRPIVPRLRLGGARVTHQGNTARNRPVGSVGWSVLVHPLPPLKSGR
jgi:hypothetical protein